MFSEIVSVSSGLKNKQQVFIVSGQSNGGDGNGLTGTNYSSVANYPSDSGIKIWNGSSFVTLSNASNNNILGGLGQGTLGDGSNNAVTWGPEVEFFYRWRKANPTTTVYIVKYCYGGKSLDNYFGTSAGGNYPFFEAPPNNTGNTGPGGTAITGTSIYDQMTTYVNAAKATLTNPRVMAILWMQGEADATNSGTASRYQTNLTNFISAARTDWGDSRTQFIMGRIANNASVWTYASTVQAAQDALNGSNGISTINTDAYPIQLVANGYHTDNFHYTEVGQISLGKDMYSAYVAYQKSQQFYIGALGGGGFCTGIHISPDGLTYCVRDDTHDGWILNTVTGKWRAALNSTSFSAATPFADIACYDIVSAPSNSAHIYMIGQTQGANTYQIYSSTDRGTTFTSGATGITGISIPVNGSYKGGGHKLAVDPNNENVIYFGLEDGTIYRSLDGGATVTHLTALDGNGTGSPSLAFDPQSGTTTLSGHTVSNILYIGWSWGSPTAVFHTTNGGSSFSATTGGPAVVYDMCCTNDATTVLYTTDALSNNNLWKYVSGSWTHMSDTSFNDRPWVTIAFDPLNAGHVCAMASGGALNRSDNYGSTWYGWANQNPVDRYLVAGANDPPWFGTTNEAYLTIGSIQFDPLVSNKLWMAEGIGIWHTTTLASNSPPTWTSQTTDQNSLIINHVLYPQGTGKLYMTCWDRGAFTYTDPSVYPTYNMPPQGAAAAITHGWTVAAAVADQTKVFLTVSNAGGNVVWKTTDGGATWTALSTQPSTGVAGSIAAQTANNIVYFPANSGTPVYTTNGGSSWSNCSFTNGEQVATSIAIVSGGTGYAVNDTIALAGGTPSSGASPQILVQAVSGGVITGATFNGNIPGQYTTPPSNPISQASSSGSGTGATFNFTWMMGNLTTLPYYYNQHILCADYVNGNYYGFAFNNGNDNKGIWKSTDGGATWTQVYSTSMSPNAGDATALIAVPGNAGNLFFGPGTQSLTNAPLLRSVDSGTTWYNDTYTGVYQAYAVCTGAPKPGNSYPTIYVIGRLSSGDTTGVYQCTNATTTATSALTWTLLTRFPANSLDGPTSIAASPDVYGSIAIGLQSSGFVYGLYA